MGIAIPFVYLILCGVAIRFKGKRLGDLLEGVVVLSIIVPLIWLWFYDRQALFTNINVRFFTSKGFYFLLILLVIVCFVLPVVREIRRFKAHGKQDHSSEKGGLSKMKRILWQLFWTLYVFWAATIFWIYAEHELTLAMGLLSAPLVPIMVWRVVGWCMGNSNSERGR